MPNKAENGGGGEDREFKAEEIPSPPKPPEFSPQDLEAQQRRKEAREKNDGVELEGVRYSLRNDKELPIDRMTPEEIVQLIIKEGKTPQHSKLLAENVNVRYPYFMDEVYQNRQAVKARQYTVTLEGGSEITITHTWNKNGHHVQISEAGDRRQNEYPGDSNQSPSKQPKINRWRKTLGRWISGE